MQSYIHFKAIVGVVVLLLISSKVTIAQHYYTPATPVYGYAPNTIYDGQQIVPSNGYYQHGYSYPVLPQAIPHQMAPPTLPQNLPQVVPPTTWSQAQPAEVVGATTTENNDTNLEAEPRADLASDETPGSESLPPSMTSNIESPGEASSIPDAAVANAGISDSSNALAELGDAGPESSDLTEPNKMESAELGPTAELDPTAGLDATVSSEVFTEQSDTEQSDTELLGQLLKMQTAIDSALPRLLPAVVAVEGGSGVIVSPQGHILTASHVTKKAGRRVLVRLANGRTVGATTLGTNVNSDTAALKLDGNGPWPSVQMGNSANVELGDWCLTLGYPLSFDRGKPAAVRIGRIIKKSPSRFTSDSPIMGGDSGGPMFDLNGGLIAISSRIKNDVSENLFVPIGKYQTEWNQLASSIDVRQKKNSQPRPYLGILGESDFDRVRIRRVYQNSPAAQAGFLENDVIVSFGGQRVENFDDVTEVLKMRKPGEEVIAQLNRYGILLNLSVRLGSIDGR